MACTVAAAVGGLVTKVLVAAVLVLLAWGALAFGAVYAWAFAPLALGCAAVGVACLVRTPPDPSNRCGAVALALGLLAVAVLLQLLPLPIQMIQSVSPGTDELLRRYDLAYATAASAFPLRYRHPLSVDPGLTRTGLLLLVSFGLLLVGLVRHVTRDAMEWLAVGLVVLGAGLAIIGMAQRALRLPEIYGFWTPMYGGAPFGPFVNRNHFAGWMLMAMPVGLGYLCALIDRGIRGVGAHWRSRLLWFATPEASRTLLIGLGVLLMGIALVMTLSRGGIGCLMLAVAISGAVSLRSQPRGTRRRLYAAYLAVLLVVAIGWAGLDAVVARFAEGSPGSLNGRVGAWTDALAIAARVPLVGTGLNTYGVATLFYQQHDLAVYFDYAHNDYLQLAAEGGVLLGVPCLLLIGAIARQIRRSFEYVPRQGRTYWVKVGAVTGMIAIAFQEVVDFSLQMPGNAVLLVVLCAIAIHRPTSIARRGRPGEADLQVRLPSGPVAPAEVGA